MQIDTKQIVQFGRQPRRVIDMRQPKRTKAASSTSITGRAQNGAETDVNTDTTKPWVRYRKSTFAFSEETVGPSVPTDPDYIYFKKSNWGGGEIVIQ